MPLPPPYPEIPVERLAEALAYYKDKLGFNVDWSDETIGLAGISQGDCRLFLADANYRATFGTVSPIVVWLNLSDRSEVDALHEHWSRLGALIPTPPQAQPYKLYEFLARDVDGNILRVFYDFGWEDRIGESDG